MNSTSFQEHLFNHARWRRNLAESVENYHAWRKKYGFDDTTTANILLNIVQNLHEDTITLAFVAEFSRGKTELINALFFGETGVRLLPSTAGRTTMCPTELFYDEGEGSYIRLLEIESRLDNTPLFALKKDPGRWQRIELDEASPAQMQSAFQELVAVKQVSKEVAIDLGLYDDRLAAELGIQDAETIEIPRWRHALISFPHPLLREGLTILDTPGLNALGSEPELTLNMLPSAQAIIFVIAADTGVTKSDMEMWTNHVNMASKVGRQGLAVVMNKIDTMWDEITTDISYRASIQSQVATTAKTLSLSEDFIFPVSAKQALIAKIKHDIALLSRSRLGEIELYLSKDIIQQRQKILKDVIAKEVRFLIKESYSLTESKYTKSSQQLQELKQLDYENQDMIAKLMADTKKQQDDYLANLNEFKTSRKAFLEKLALLMDALSPKRVDALVKYSRHQMNNSLTTFGLKNSMRKLFDDLRDLLQNCVEATQSTGDQIKTIHKQFQDHYGFMEIEPKLFDIEPYQKALEELFEEGEAFRHSSRIAITEQSLVVKKLNDTLFYKARKILRTASYDAETWGKNIMSPLMHQIIAYKKQIEDRLAVLNSALESKEDLQENLARIGRDLQMLTTQKFELETIVNSIETELAIFKQSLQP